jgi:NADPH:quinone reductase
MTARSIRAVRVHELGAIGNGRIEQIPEPVAGPNEVLVDIHAVAANFVDVVTIEGRYQFQPALPYIPGKGPAGIVRAVGADVAGIEVGQRVVAMAEYGGYAEAVTVDHRQVHRLPDSLDFAGAATFSVSFDTAWMALRDRARFTPGDSVLVLGATGAVGGATIQLAKAMGASRVLAGLVSPERLDPTPLADLVDGRVDLGRPNLAESIRDQVFDLTDGTGVDIIVDSLGGDSFDGGIRSLAWRGRYVVVGFASGRIATLKSNYVLLKNIEVSGLQISDYRKRMPDLVAQGFSEIFTLVDGGAITVPPHRIMPLEAWTEAMEAIKARRADRRLVLEPR